MSFRENAMATSSINTIPVDVVLEIMMRLPVKSLIRFRLIAKSYFSITATSNFITSHLALSKSSGYAALSSLYSNISPPCILFLDKSFFEVLRQEIPFSFSYLSEPGYWDAHNYFLVVSCCGLLCLTDNRMGYLGHDVVLWNPMIRKFKSISDTSLNSNMLDDATTSIALGLWFDGKNHDYKLIRIVVSEYKNESSPQAEIYSLKTESWRKVIFPIDSVSKILFFESLRCAFVHGALHWVACLSGLTNSPYDSVILSFKIDDEQFKVIRLPPDYASRGEIVSINVMGLKGSLVVAIVYKDMEDGVMEICRVWKMNKYEEVESWTEQILPITPISWCHGCTKDGELMLNENDFQVSLYNLETGTLKQTNIEAVEFVVPFRESLVLL